MPPRSSPFLLEPAFWLYVIFFSGIITIAQACYLWPARKPRITAGKGRSIKLSVTIAGLTVGLGGLAMLLGIVGLFDQEMASTFSVMDSVPLGARILFWVLMLFVFWVLPTLILLRFCGSGQREDVLGRLANRVLLGTAAEAALLIPIDALIRRRTDCYCAEGTFLGLTVLGAIGFVGAGPAVLLPLFARRRRGWYRTHCNACGYDMRGDPAPERCPECGREWDLTGVGTRAGDEAGTPANHPDQPNEPDDEGHTNQDKRDNPVGSGL